MFCSSIVLPGARSGDDQAALPLADGRHEVHDARRQIVRRSLELRSLQGIQGRQVLEENLVARLVGRFEVDRLDLDEGKVALSLLRRPDLAGHRIARLQVELADLRRRDIYVVGARQIIVIRRAQEAETVRKHLEHSLGEDEPTLLGLCLQDLENQLLLAHSGRAGDVQILRHLGERADAHFLELADVERVLASAGGLGHPQRTVLQLRRQPGGSVRMNVCCWSACLDWNSSVSG